MQRLVDTGHGEDGEADGVKEKPRVVLSCDARLEDDDPYQGDGGADEIDGVGHPEGGDAQQDIAHRTAAYGCGESDDVGTKPVKVFAGSEAGAGDGKGEGADEVKYLVEGGKYDGVHGSVVIAGGMAACL